MANKLEPRFSVDLPIRVFGVDDDDHAFSQIVHSRNISDHGAKLAGLEEHLKAGDIIGVHFGDKNARCNVIWVVDQGCTYDPCGRETGGGTAASLANGSADTACHGSLACLSNRTYGGGEEKIPTSTDFLSDRNPG